MTQILNHCKFAICIINEGSDDLQVWKLYKLLDDPKALLEDYLRVIDESGEDYLYPANRFEIVEFSKLIEQRILASVVLNTSLNG